MAKMEYRLNRSYRVYGHSTPGYLLLDFSGLAPLARRKTVLSSFAFRLSGKEHSLKKATTDKLHMAKIEYRLSLSYHVYRQSAPGHFLPDFSGRADLSSLSFRLSAKEHGLKKVTTDDLDMARMK